MKSAKFGIIVLSKRKFWKIEQHLKGEIEDGLSFLLLHIIMFTVLFSLERKYFLFYLPSNEGRLFLDPPCPISTFFFNPGILRENPLLPLDLRNPLRPLWSGSVNSVLQLRVGDLGTSKLITICYFKNM